MGREELKTLVCPICGRRHIYPLYIERTLLSTNFPYINGPRNYSKSFWCPIKKKHFEHLFSMKETQITSIISLKVGKPITGEIVTLSKPEIEEKEKLPEKLTVSTFFD